MMPYWAAIVVLFIHFRLADINKRDDRHLNVIVVKILYLHFPRNVVLVFLVC